MFIFSFLRIFSVFLAKKSARSKIGNTSEIRASNLETPFSFAISSAISSIFFLIFSLSFSIHSALSFILRFSHSF